MIPEYEERLNDLKNRVSHYVTIPNKSNMTSTKHNILKNYYYLAIPYISIIVLLLIFRPSFIYEQKLDVKKINIMKVIKITLITGIVIDIVLFIYFKRFIHK